MNGSPEMLGPAAAESDFTAAQPALRPPQRAEIASFEREITRLTWLVLDGSATLADRQRLGEVVDAQHARRQRGAASPANPQAV